MKSIHFNCISHFKYIILLILFTKFHISESSENSEIVLNEIEENQLLTMECSTYLKTIEMLINDYDKLNNSSTIKCQLDIKTSADQLKIKIDKNLDQKLNDYLKNINEMKLKLSEIIEINNLKSVEKCYSELQEVNNNQNNISINEELKQFSFRIRNGTVNESDRRQLNVNDEIQMKILISGAYRNDLNNGLNIIEFLNTFNDIEDILLGYRILFDVMVANQHVESTLTTTIAFKIYTDFGEKFSNNPNYLYLNSKMPNSLKNFPWNKIVIIQNLQINSTICGYSGVYFDDLRQNIYSVVNTNGRNSIIYQYNFIPISNGTYFHIKNVFTNEFMYADKNSFGKDNEHRRVFGWRKKNESLVMGKWNFEIINGSSLFKIKNIYWDEYLMIDKNHIHPQHSNHYEVFTLKSNKCEFDGCLWNIEKIN